MSPLPLSGQSIVVTRPAHQSHIFQEKLERRGAQVVLLPAIKLLPNLGDSSFQNAIQDIGQFDWVIFTSVNGVEAVVRQFDQLGLDLAALLKCKLAAIGPATRQVLIDLGAQGVVMPDEFVSESVAPCLGDVSGKKILLPRADIARKDLATILTDSGAEVTQVDAYSITSNIDADIISQVRSFPLDFVPDFMTFTSSSTATGIHELLVKAGREDWLNESELVAIGPITAKTMQQLGMSPSRTANDYTTDGIIDALLSEEGNI